MTGGYFFAVIMSFSVVSVFLMGLDEVCLGYFGVWFWRTGRFVCFFVCVFLLDDATQRFISFGYISYIISLNMW